MGLFFQNGGGGSGSFVYADIDGQTEDTTPAVGDFVATADISAAALKKVTLANVIKGAGASQAEQETGSATDRAVTPARQQSHASAAKAWVRVDVSAGTPSATASYNVTSITDVAAGKYTVNFTTAFSSGNYAMAGIVEFDEGTAFYDIGVDGDTPPTTTACRIYTVTLGSVFADVRFWGACFFGDQ